MENSEVTRTHTHTHIYYKEPIHLFSLTHIRPLSQCCHCPSKEYLNHSKSPCPTPHSPMVHPPLSTPYGAMLGPVLGVQYIAYRSATNMQRRW